MLQDLVDRLSSELGRPVLIDDRALEPLAYSRQIGPVDEVRTASVLTRGVSGEVRAALLGCGIAQATGPLHCPADPALGMTARLCVPIASAGYLWIIEDAPLTDAEVALAVAAAQRAAVLLAVESTAEVALARERAQVALEAGGGRWGDLGGARRMLAHIDVEAALRDAPPGALRLLDSDLAETLAVYLQRAGDVQATAAALSLHRAGVYYRLKRIEELTGLDLHDGDDRLVAALVLE